jgi:hypothetical protein
VVVSGDRLELEKGAQGCFKLSRVIRTLAHCEWE